MEWFKKYQYPIISGLLGVILACFILFFGFFKTLFVLILGALGAGIGYYIQNKKNTFLYCLYFNLDSFDSYSTRIL